MAWPRLWSPRWHPVWLGLGCAFAAWLISFGHMVAGLEDWMLDACFIGRGTRPSAARAKIVIVEIDEAFVRKIGKPSSHLSPELARAVRCLASHTVAAVGIDLLIPDDMGGLPEIAAADGKGEARSMGDAVAEAGNVVVPVWKLPEGLQYPLEEWQRAQLRAEAREPDDGRILPYLATVNVQDDGDHFFRRAQLASEAEGKAWAHFALAVLAVARKQPIRIDEHGVLSLGDEALPTGTDHFLRINYVGPPGTFRRIKFSDLLESDRTGKRLEGLEGAIVLVGITAAGFQDYHATPYSNSYSRWLPGDGNLGRMAGIEMHANILATLFDRAPVRETGWLALPLLLGVGGLMGWLYGGMGLRGVACFTVLHHFLWKLAAVAAFALVSLRLPVVSMLALGGFLGAGTFVLRWRRVRKALALLSAEEVAVVMESGEGHTGPMPGKRHLTVLFADVRGFTSYSEGRDPSQVVRLLNAYFNIIVPVIESHGGTLNQYMGDGVMVLFGAPEPDDAHAANAVRAAVEMVRAVRANRDRWAKEGFARLSIGVGVNTGEAVVGLIGSRSRMNYTAIGETTNMAARIEAANKDLKTEILVSVQTYHELGEAAAELGCRPVPEPGKVKETELLVHAVDVA